MVGATLSNIFRGLIGGVVESVLSALCLITGLEGRKSAVWFLSGSDGRDTTEGGFA